MKTSYKSPLQGKPWTVQTEDRNGLPKFTITARALTPPGARVADTVRDGLRIGAACGAVWIVMNEPKPELGFIGFVGIGAYTGYRLLASYTKELLSRRTVIVMSPDTIKVRRWFGWHRYDRLLKHQFVLLGHDQADSEARQNDHEIREASAQGKVITKEPYFGNSYHVSLLYAGQRIDVLTAYGHPQASAIAARLRLCDALLDRTMKMAGGLEDGPEYEDYTGGLQ